MRQPENGLSGLLGFGHHPAYTAYIFNVLFADFFAQAVNQKIDGVAFHFFAPAVDLSSNSLRDRMDACAVHQGLQHGEFFLAQRDAFRLPFQRGLVGSRVKLNAAVAQQRAGLPAWRRRMARMRALSSAMIKGLMM